MKIRTKNNIRFISTLSILSVVYFTAVQQLSLSASVERGLLLAGAIAFLNGIFQRAVLVWASRRSNNFFFGTFFGLFFWKLVCLGGCALFVAMHSDFHFASTLLSLALLTFIVSLMAIRTLPPHPQPDAV